MSFLKEIIVDENDKLFNKENMYYHEFNSNLKNIKFYISKIIKKIPINLSESKLLEQQIGELISNVIWW